MSKKSKPILIETAFDSILPKPIEISNAIDVKGSGKWVKWGENNKLPNQLYSYYMEVSNLQSIILTYIDYLVGGGVKSNYPFTNTDGETIEEVVKKAVEDYCIFGCYSLECIRNSNGDIVNILYQDVRNVRISEDYNTAYLASEWGSFNSKNMVELPLYNKDFKQPHFLYFYNGNSRGWYGTPFYFAALKSIEILRLTRNFHLNNLTNNFSVNAIITFCNGTPSKTVQSEISKKMNEQFCGTENASRLFINYADNKDNAPQIQRLQSDQFGELYKTLAESSTDDIYQACRINKMLLGANILTGFNKEEFNECAKLFQKTTIDPLQRKIKRSLAAIGINIELEKYKFEEE